MSQAAEIDLRYFNNMATLHCVNEEYNLLP